ncbi:MAG: CsbD family protein [Lacipirellulaceae bacterium]
MTATSQQIEGGWNELKGKVKKKWGALNDDELRQFQGSTQELVGMVERATGTARKEVEEFVASLHGQVGPKIGQAVEAVQSYAGDAAEAAGEAISRVRDQVAATHADAENLVRQRPVESVAVAFGAGIIAGVVIGLMNSSRR